MQDDDLPPKPHEAEETAAGDFGQLIGAGAWIVLFLILGGIIFYIAARAYG